MRVLIVLAAGAAFAGTALAAPAPETSWGKPGVSFEDYRADAARCLNLVERVDLSGTEPARVLATASRRIEDALPQAGPAPTESSEVPSEYMLASQRIARIVEQARPEHRIRQARDILQVAMSECLTILGYRRFRLTEEQQRQLARLRTGRAARHAFLHSLASDPRVLEAQRAE